MTADKIEMIKRVRELTKVGLKEAKEAVERADGDFDRALELLGARRPQPGEEPVFTPRVKGYGHGFIAVSAAGFPIAEGAAIRIWREPTRLGFADARSGLTTFVGFTEVSDLTVGGPGLIQSGGGFSGGGIGVAGFALGASAASLLNRLTTRYSVQTVLRVASSGREITAVTDELMPEALDAALASVRVAMREAASGSAGDPIVDQLERLAALRDRGVLTEAEFAQQKARILGAG